MSAASPAINENIEVIQVLCTGGAMTFNAILGSLQNRFPETGWTSDLLQTRLDNGIVEGRFKAIGSAPYAGDIIGYNIDFKMVRNNPSVNKVYECFCSKIHPVDIQVPGVGFY